MKGPNIMNDIKLKPKIGSAMISDSAIRRPSGKYTLNGVFTNFKAWSFPCRRHCFITTTIFYTPKGNNKLDVFLAKGDIKENIQTINLKNEEFVDGTVIPFPIEFSLSEEGEYLLICKLKGQRKEIKIPFFVTQEPWPEFTEQEIEFAKSNPNIINKINANVQCTDCSHAYIFQESILNEPPEGGVLRFPKDGILKCKQCGHEMNMKDIQGRLRSSLLENIRTLMHKD